jgi:hypothetical protein
MFRDASCSPWLAHRIRHAERASRPSARTHCRRAAARAAVERAAGHTYGRIGPVMQARWLLPALLGWRGGQMWLEIARFDTPFSY